MLRWAIGEMKRDRFYHILNNPDAANDEDLAEIERLSVKFPWFPAGHSLTALVHHLQNLPEKSKSLKTASVYSGNRSVLSDRINRQKLRDTIEAFEKAISSDKPEFEELEAKEPNEAVLEPAPDNDRSEINVQHKPLPGPGRQEVRPELSQTEKETEEYDALETEILLEAVAVMIDNEVTGSIDTDIFVQRDEAEFSENDTLPDQADDFTNWLKVRSNSIGYDLNDKQNRPLVTQSEPNGKKSISELIDDFIKNEPKITPGKAEEYANKVHGANALVEDENFVTETLAAIYARQGKTAKAKKAYRLLSLKYPEKSVYFAAQIKKLDRGEL